MTRTIKDATPMNGIAVSRRNTTIFIPLPRRLWRSCGTCQCAECAGREGFWDTVAVEAAKPKSGADTTWTVHIPKDHPCHDRDSAGRFYTDPKNVPEVK